MVKFINSKNLILSPSQKSLTKNNHNEHKLVEVMHELPADIATWKLSCLFLTHVSLSLQKAIEEKVGNSPN